MDGEYTKWTDHNDFSHTRSESGGQMTCFVWPEHILLYKKLLHGGFILIRAINDGTYDYNGTYGTRHYK